MLGLTPAAELDEVERRLFGPRMSRSVRGELSVSALSERDRPANLPEWIQAAFVAAGLAPPVRASQLQYSYRFQLPSGSDFDVWFERGGRPSAFSYGGNSNDEQSDVRRALQMHLTPPTPAEIGIWSRSLERKMRASLEEQGILGLWITHEPLVTSLAIRRSRFPTGSTGISLRGTRDTGFVVIQHALHRPSQVKARGGDAYLTKQLVAALHAHGLAHADPPRPATE